MNKRYNEKNYDSKEEIKHSQFKFRVCCPIATANAHVGVKACCYYFCYFILKFPLYFSFYFNF